MCKLNDILLNASLFSDSVLLTSPLLSTASLTDFSQTRSLTMRPSSSSFASHLLQGKTNMIDPSFSFSNRRTSTFCTCQPGPMPELSCPIRIFSRGSPISSSCSIKKYESFTCFFRILGDAAMDSCRNHDSSKIIF